MSKFSHKQPGWTSNGRKASQASRSIRKSLFFIFLFFVVIWAGLVFVRSDFFSLKQVVISGNERLSEEEIREALQVKQGDNILQLSMQLLVERLLLLPRVESVEITRCFP